jgi:uncharacterized membrane protein
MPYRGGIRAAISIGLLEPSIQAAVFLLHERIWEGPASALALSAA